MGLFVWVNIGIFFIQFIILTKKIGKSAEILRGAK